MRTAYDYAAWIMRWLWSGLTNLVSLAIDRVFFCASWLLSRISEGLSAVGKRLACVWPVLGCAASSAFGLLKHALSRFVFGLWPVWRFPFRFAWGIARYPVEFAFTWTVKPIFVFLKWLGVSPLKWLCLALWGISEAPRRYLSHTIFNVMFGYHDSLAELGEESIPPNEEDVIKRTLQILEQRHKRDYPPGVRPMLRDFHGKTHACLAAVFKLEKDLPAEVRHGVFKEPGKALAAVVRFSNGSRNLGSDRQPNQHGMALKVILDDGQQQDFILSDFPVAFMPNAENAFDFYRAEAAERHFAYFVRNPVSMALLFLCSAFQPQKDVFEAHYFSQTPYRLGPKRACKFIARPAKHVPGQPPTKHDLNDLPASPNYLRTQIAARLAVAGDEIAFNFFVQPQRSPIRQPIENSSFQWSEREAPPIKVATITIVRPKIPFTSPEAQWHNELISFSPERKNGIPDHQPIGGLNRVRKAVYRRFADMRFRANGVAERHGIDAIPPGSGNQLKYDMNVSSLPPSLPPATEGDPTCPSCGAST